MSDTIPTSVKFPGRTLKKPCLTNGALYKGVVVGNVLPNQIIQVKIEGFRGHLEPCVWAAGIISGLLGFKTHYIPPANTKVVVLHVEEAVSYIIAAIPSLLPGMPREPRTLTGPGADAYQDLETFTSQQMPGAPTAMGSKPPVDLVEGEINIENLLGVGLTLLRHLSSLQAGDLARVECHLLDDMVRIISDTFKQYSAFGDYKIVNDGGRLNVVWHGTSHEHEAWGNLRANDPKVSLKNEGDSVDFENSGIDGYNDEGRWRFSQYLGWLGNFINIFVTDPINALGRLAEDQFRSGKARLHVNDDGSVLIQSVADIVLEKVVRIPVPTEIRREDDPVGNRSDDSPKKPDPLKTWQPSNTANIFEMAFQLREYARWLNNSYSLGRFRQMDRDYKVPTEAQVPTPDLSGKDPEKAELNAGIQNWQIAYSTIRIYRDGSIQTVDAYGNSITTTKIGIHIATPRDLLLQAGGSINIVAGRDVNVVGRRNINLAAIQEAVRIKAQTSLQVLCAAGNILIEAFNKKVVKILAGLNIGNKVSVDSINGNIESEGIITAEQMAAAITMVVDDHSQHLFPGIPDVIKVNGEFKFQDIYDKSIPYETITQQLMKAGDFAGSETWNFEDNKVEGRGSPWPGKASHVEHVAEAESLNIPSESKEFSGKPASLKVSPLTMKVQQ